MAALKILLQMWGKDVPAEKLATDKGDVEESIEMVLSQKTREFGLAAVCLTKVTLRDLEVINRPAIVRIDEGDERNYRKEIDLSAKTGLRLNEIGEETIKPLITQTPTDVSLLTQEIFAGVSKVHREPSQIERLLSNATYGKTGKPFLRNEIWGVCDFNIEVKKH